MAAPPENCDQDPLGFLGGDASTNSTREVRKLWFKFSRAYHPDKNSTNENYDRNTWLTGNNCHEWLNHEDGTYQNLQRGIELHNARIAREAAAAAAAAAREKAAREKAAREKAAREKAARIS